MKPKAVLAYCREKGIKAIDLRFTDLFGAWRHVTFPLSALTEASFEEGFGQGIVLTPSSNANPAHAILVPQSEANYLDPFPGDPTLVLVAAIQDSLIREDSPLDTRQIACRAVRYLASTSIGDGVQVRTFFPYRNERSEEELKPLSDLGSTYMMCGPADPDYLTRSVLSNSAADAGLLLDRHFCDSDFGSMMVLKASDLVEACDDVQMMRYLVSQFAWKKRQTVDYDRLWMTTQWSITKQSEPVFVGNSHRGLSEIGMHAIGGMLKHLDSIVALATFVGSSTEDFHWTRQCAENDPQSVCRIEIASHNPRSRWIEFLGTPAQANPYLVNAGILMAAIDGIQNKASIKDNRPLPTTRGELANTLSDGRDFLLRGEVFSDELIDLVAETLRTPA